MDDVYDGPDRSNIRPSGVHQALAGRGDKAFEIRKGRRKEEGDDDDGGPSGPVVLPQSITQEAEDERLRKRFGVEQLPEIDKLHSSVRVTTSEGAFGPDRKRMGLKILFVLFALLIVGAGAYLHQQGALDAFLK